MSNIYDKDNGNDDPQRAFREFMLHGSKKKRDQSTPTPPPPKPTTNTGTAIGKAHQDARLWQNQKQYKQHQQARQAFLQNWKTGWCQTDDLLARVVASVADLKARWRLLQRYSSSPPSHPHNALTEDDLTLALQYTLRKYEQAWQQLRGLLAQLAQDQQTLGRRLQEVLTTTTQHVDAAENDCNRIYQTAAADLWRKQKWGQELLDHAYIDTDQAEQRALVIANQWNRTHPSSPWQV